MSQTQLSFDRRWKYCPSGSSPGDHTPWWISRVATASQRGFYSPCVQAQWLNWSAARRASQSHCTSRPVWYLVYWATHGNARLTRHRRRD